MRLLLAACLLDRRLRFSLSCEVIDTFLTKRCWRLKPAILCETMVSESTIYICTMIMYQSLLAILFNCYSITSFYYKANIPLNTKPKVFFIETRTPKCVLSETIYFYITLNPKRFYFNKVWQLFKCIFQNYYIVFYNKSVSWLFNSYYH